jgi:hypothetical protein
MRLGLVEYAKLDLRPGAGITSALGWQCPVDRQGGGRGALLLPFETSGAKKTNA